MLMDLDSLTWSDPMLSDFGIKRECLPEIRKSSSDHFGEVSASIECIQGVTIGGYEFISIILIG